MTKYWKSISIAVITVAAIGFFYIQSTLAGTNYPEFGIETLSGNEEAVEDLILDGDYREGNIKGDNFQITAEGTQYNGELSYFDRLDRDYRFPEMNQLQENYKDFMRGKQSMFQLAENERYLVYANINSLVRNASWRPSSV
jgi:glutaredoxin-related protein